MSDIHLFKKGLWQVRTGNDADGTDWVVAQDVCSVLDVDRTQIRRIPDSMKGVRLIHTLGGDQEMAVLFEAGIYRLAFTSRKPEAEAFTDWVASEVLPSIRKHGMYATPATVEAMLADPDTMIKTLTALKDERAARAIAESKLAVAAPKVQFYDAVTASDDLMDIGKAAKVLGIKELGRNNLFSLLREKSVLMDNNTPYQRYVDAGYFVLKEIPGWKDREGNYHPSYKTYATQRGLAWLQRRLSARAAN